MIAERPAAPARSTRDPQAQLLFHLTGRLSDADGLEPVGELDLRPALFARFHDLPSLRYDFPLVLVDDEADPATPLSAVIDAILDEVAPAGMAGDRVRRSVLRLERELRVLLADGMEGRLGALWDGVAERLAAKGGAPVSEDLRRARAALRIDGPLVACDERMPARLVAHVRRAVQARKGREMRRTIDTLVVKLTDLVKADHLRSEAGRHADTLRSGIGPAHQGLFDFDAMARLLAAPSGKSALAPERRRRIEDAVAVLRTEPFFHADAPDGGSRDLDDALAALRDRLPRMAAVVRAIAIGELEIAGEYADAVHDPYFADFDARSLGPRDVALFPDALVRFGPRDLPAADAARILEALSTGLPVKILVETDDVLDEPSTGEGGFSLAAQLARSAMGLEGVFVVQSSSAQLPRMRERLRAALAYDGPALISVFTASADAFDGIDPYLVAAAAADSRAFPAFSYDPSAGPDWARRFALGTAAQPDRDWPVHPLAYADDALQRVSVDAAFTFADFVACDPRHARHFALVPKERWTDRLAPIADIAAALPGSVPFVQAIDGDDRLHRLIVDERLLRATRRCAEEWQRLRELDGLKRPREVVVAAPAVIDAAPAEPATAEAAAAPVAAAPEPAAERSSDEAYIETPRCTSCNECTTLSATMFAYNENKQAYIKDPRAGTYRQLVEAAESCQVAIIHPGKPLDPNEPGLEELIERAQPFL